jgi:uncharacterized protein YjdB
VATVNPASGEVTAISVGTATITATTEDGSFKDTCVVTVAATATVPVEGVSLSASELELTPTNGDFGLSNTATLTVTFTPASPTNQNVTWSSDNPTVVSVVNGVLTVAADAAVDRATITVKTADGNYTAKCEVTVVAMANFN